MVRTIALISFGAAVLWLVPAFAQTGYGVKPGSPSTSTFDRSWKRANESKDRARAGVAYVRRHSYGYGPHRHYSQ